MLILGGVSTVKNNQIFIPYYHRGHISLKSNTTVTLALIPPNNSTGSPQLTEMVVSPIDFRSWPSLWRIEATFLECPGVVNKLLTIVAEEGLNVLNEESSSVENRDFHSVELIVDTQRISKRQDEISENERMHALENRIIAHCIENLKFERGRPRLRVKRMKGLQTAWEKFEESRNNIQTLRPIQDISHISSGFVELPAKIKAMISGQTPLCNLLVSDTKERLLRVFFLHEDTGFTYVRIEHHDSPGALALITGELAKAFDIVNSLTRIQRQGSQNDLELLLYSSQFPHPGQELTRRRIIQDLISSESLRNLKLRFSFPKSVGSAERGSKPPKGSKSKIKVSEPKKIAQVDDNLQKLSTAAILQHRIKEYEPLVEREPNFEKRAPLQQRWEYLRALLRVEGEPNPKPRIFVSYDFSRTDLFEIIKKRCKQLKFRVVTGANPDEQSAAFRDVIIGRIRSCDAFLGIWTKRSRGSSPWFLWELGVAQAMNPPLPYRLLIHKGINSEQYLKIIPERHHRIFDDLEFSKESKVVIDRLFEELKQKQRARGFNINL